MEKQAIFKSNAFKVFVVVATAAALMKIFGSGYDFGQWLYQYTH